MDQRRETPITPLAEIGERPSARSARVADRLALVAVVGWIIGATVARRAGIWIGIGAASVALGATALLLRAAPLVADRARPSSRAARLAVGLAVGAAMSAATYALYPLLVALVPSSAADARRLFAAFAALSPARATLLLAPIIVGEELVWRGVVQRALARRAGPIATVVLAALAYAVGHAPFGSSLLVAVAFACGLLWSALRAITGDLVAPLAAHFLWDLCVLVLHPVVR